VQICRLDITLLQLLTSTDRPCKVRSQIYKRRIRRGDVREAMAGVPARAVGKSRRYLTTFQMQR
jgi:hypothetical protein